MLLMKMRKTLVAIAFSVFFAQPTLAQRIENPGGWDGAVSQKDAITLAKLINAYGYKCASISSVRKMIMKRGFTVYCNSFNYTFNVEDRGGKYSVTYQ